MSELLQTLCATEIQTSTCQHKGMATRIGTWQTPQGAHKNSGIWKRQNLGMDVTTRRPTHPREDAQPKGRQREKRITVCMSPVVTVIMTQERDPFKHEPPTTNNCASTTRCETCATGTALWGCLIDPCTHRLTCNMYACAPLGTGSHICSDAPRLVSVMLHPSHHFQLQRQPDTKTHTVNKNMSH